ncbi:MAG TPA: cytochrome c [Terriglobia bacterium]|nr:cytochrome c [Terriglobia bacterium]
MKRSYVEGTLKMIGWSLALVVAGLFLLSSLSLAGQPAADEGAATFKAKCAMCHGPDGSGDTTMGKKMKIKDLRSAEVQKQTDADLAGIIAKGKPPMSGYEKQLDKEKIDQVVAFLRELGKKK